MTTATVTTTTNDDDDDDDVEAVTVFYTDLSLDPTSWRRSHSLTDYQVFSELRTSFKKLKIEKYCDYISQIS